MFSILIVAISLFSGPYSSLEIAKESVNCSIAGKAHDEYDAYKSHQYIHTNGMQISKFLGYGFSVNEIYFAGEVGASISDTAGTCDMKVKSFSDRSTFVGLRKKENYQIAFVLGKEIQPNVLSYLKGGVSFSKYHIIMVVQGFPYVSNIIINKMIKQKFLGGGIEYALNHQYGIGIQYIYLFQSNINILSKNHLSILHPSGETIGIYLKYRY